MQESPPETTPDTSATGASSGSMIDNLNTETIMEYAVPVAGALVILIIGWIIAGMVARATTRAMIRGKIEETLARFAGKMVKWGLLVLVVLVCLQRVGVQVTTFAAVIAAAGFAVGMALSGTISNFAAGVMLLIFRPFKVGDVVSVAGHTGKVFEVDLFVTTLDTPDNRRLIIPNGAIFGSSIENVSHHATRRVDVAVGTDYSADIDKTREILLKAASSVENVLPDPAPAIVLAELGGSSIDWSVRVWVDAANFWPVKDALTRAVKYALDDANIGIPFPQMDVHVTNQ